MLDMDSSGAVRRGALALICLRLISRLSCGESSSPRTLDIQLGKLTVVGAGCPSRVHRVL